MISREGVSRIALCVSVCGIALLLLLAESLDSRHVKIKDIGMETVGWRVRVNARIDSFSQRDGIAFMQLYDGTGKIKAVMFKPGREEQALLGKNGFATFEGKVQLYKGELELVVLGVEQWA